MLPSFQGDFGAAYLLRTRATANVELLSSAFAVKMTAGSPYVMIAMTGSASLPEVKARTWSALQDALDIEAARTRRAHATQNAERGYLTWHLGATGYDVTYVETANFGWSASGTIAGGGPAAPPPPPPMHHPALRFYRLSQISDDLFDAYRNAYLAFECLISSESPKAKHEKELHWLQRVSKESFPIPGGIDIDSCLTKIYNMGRLPLFHAKMSESFFTPQGAERERLLELLETLTFLLVSFLRHKGHDAALWGSMSHSVYDAQSRVNFECDAVRLRVGMFRCTVTPSIEVMENPRRFGNLWCRITVRVPNWLPLLTSIETRLKRQPRIFFDLEESIRLTGVSNFSIELNEIHRHSRSPRQLHVT